MIVPFVLMLMSLAGIAAAFLPGLFDLLLLAVPGLLASLFLFVRAVKGRPAAARWIMVDGSNVMHWQDGTARTAPLTDVIGHLTALGFTPGVVFDANAGYKIVGQYKHHAALGRMLGLPENQVMVVPKGTQADGVLLATARDHGAQIVSNDRFRDWADTHPEVTKAGHLIRGGYRNGKLWLDLN